MAGYWEQSKVKGIDTVHVVKDRRELPFNNYNGNPLCQNTCIHSSGLTP